MRHGKGKWTKPDGTVILGDFRNDKAEGLCSIKEIGKVSRLVIYKSGMEIRLEGNYLTCGLVGYAILSVLFQCACIAGPILANTLPEITYWGTAEVQRPAYYFFCATFLIYICMSWKTFACMYLRN